MSNQEVYLGMDIDTLSYILTLYGQQIGAVKVNEYLNVKEYEIEEDEDLVIFTCELNKKEIN